MFSVSISIWLFPVPRSQSSHVASFLLRLWIPIGTLYFLRQVKQRPQFLWFSSIEDIYFSTITLNLCVFISKIKHRWNLFFFTQSDNLCLLISVFSPLIFNVINGMVGFNSISLFVLVKYLLVFCLFYYFLTVPVWHSYLLVIILRIIIYILNLSQSTLK